MSTLSPEAKQAAEKAGYYGFVDKPAQPGYIYAEGYDAATAKLEARCDELREELETLAELLRVYGWIDWEESVQKFLHRQQAEVGAAVRTREIAQIAQALLTALNVGDVASGCALHLKLREVMVANRTQLAHQQPSPPSDGLVGASATTPDAFTCERCGAALGWCEPTICDKCGRTSGIRRTARHRGEEATTPDLEKWKIYAYCEQRAERHDSWDVRCGETEIVNGQSKRVCLGLVEAHNRALAQVEESLRRSREPLVALVQEWEHRARAIREAPDSIKNGYIRGTLVATNAHAEELRAALTGTGGK